MHGVCGPRAPHGVWPKGTSAAMQRPVAMQRHPIGPCNRSYQVAHVLNLGDLVVVELQLGEHVQAIEVVDQRQVLEAVGQALDVAPGDAALLVGRMVWVAAQDL